MLNLKNTLDGYLKNVEVIGNTIQDTNNLANIRSVGDKVEGQELYNISIQVDNGDGVSEVVEILSPVQLEKVGDVADRIICKDGVWGIEKKVDAEVKNNVLVNTRTKSEFIPLPYDQQVKLRTFAGQTNISFLTEIPGQIKAQVPKSLGATVNTHTEQIAELHNSLDRVKKLEETTVSTIETVSNFTTVDATSNGYFEDVKLEGKTLVNALRLGGNWFEQETTLQTDSTTAVGLSQCTKTQDLSLLKNNTMYTVIPFIDYTAIKKGNLYLQLNTEIDGIQNAVFRIDEAMFNKPTLITTKELTNKNSRSLFLGGANCEYKVKNVKILMLEGDHTDNPPSYFEGLMSVGQDVEEVSVESVGLNLLDITRLGDAGTYISNPGIVANNSDLERRATDYIKVLPDTEYTIRGIQNSGVTNSGKSLYVREYAGDKSVGVGHVLHVTDDVITFRTSNTARYIRTTVRTPDINRCIISRGSVETSYIPHQSNKKPLLYYNPTTETWEKPILREWDTIEKHSDGKYYYHKRSGEVVLNGGEGWSSYIDLGNTARCYFTLNTPAGGSIGFNAICDKFIQSTDVNKDAESMWITTNNNRLGINIIKSKLSTQDVEGFKQWLQANNVTVVYQLAQEKVYECTNIDLMTYSGETNYIINSGAISPKSLLKVHNNISNVVKILQEKVSLLENTFIAGLKSVLAGDMYSLATILYPEDFEQNDNTEQDIMVIPE